MSLRRDARLSYILRMEIGSRVQFLDRLRAIGGEIARLICDKDWAGSPLGTPTLWSPALQTSVDLMLRAGTQIVMFWGPDLVALYNDAYAPGIGDKHPRALGRPARENWGELWDDLAPLLNGVIETGKTFFSQDRPFYIERHGYGENTYWDVSYSAIVEADGSVGGVMCIVTETTGRVQARVALEESEHRLRELNATLERRVVEALAERRLMADIVDGTDAFVQVVDREYRWLAVNRAAADEFETIYGRRPAAGLSMLELLAGKPEHQAEVRAVWSRALSGEEFTETQQFGDAARARRWYEMKFNVLRDSRGKQICAYQFVYDVTERLRDQTRLAEVEAQIRQTQKIEALGQLTGGVAHDFNNLLMVIRAGVTILRRTALETGKRERLLESMERAVQRGATLSSQLLAFSRKKALKPETIDLPLQLQAMRELLQRSLRGDVQVKTQFPPDLWPVRVDPAELEFVILNLCVNARDAMPQGGVITIQAENLPDIRKPDVTGDFVALSVSDRGSGMTPEVLAHAFEPFFTTKELGRGSGLGLAQVHGFAKQSEGSVEIVSEVGLGTTVTLLLPRTAVMPAAVPPATQPVSSSVQHAASGAILLVEDDNEVAALVSEMLQELGYTVIRAATATAALGALADNRSVDLVLSDVMMPGDMNGIQLAEELRRRRPELPVLLTTGYASRSTGLDKFQVLQKPYDLAALESALTTARSKSASERE